MNVIPCGKPRLNLQGKSKISERNWKNSAHKDASVAAMRSGEMCESQVNNCLRIVDVCFCFSVVVYRYLLSNLNRLLRSVHLLS